jgi:immune inhibitor A
MSDSLRRTPREDDLCAIPPSPELADRWRAELARMNEADAAPVGGAASMPRSPRRLGYNDGVIIPPDRFPLGTSLASIREAAADRAPLRGDVRVVVVLIEYSDQAMNETASHFEDLFFSTGKLPNGSVREYYTEVTGGLINITGEVVGPFTMPQTGAWYANGNFGIGKGGGEARAPQMAHDAAVAADPSVDFGPYDNDGNGYVDAFIVVHPGPGGEASGQKTDIWSHKWTLPVEYSTDNTRIFGYLTVPEDSKIGVCAHELGHLLFGFLDLYDIDYSSEGIGNWCLMAGGSWNGGGDVPAHPSAPCKVDQGWASSSAVSTSGSVTVLDVKNSRNVLRLWKNGAGGAEYFLVENRQQSGYDSLLPGSGLLVWHVDEGQADNSDESHYRIALLQADGKRDLELNHNRGDAGDPFPGSAGNTALTSSTTPNTRAYSGQTTCVSIASISASSASMTATITVRCAKTKDTKEHKEGRKDLKDAAKELKQDRPDRPTAATGQANDPTGRLTAIEARLEALEDAVGAGRALPFISADLRPDLAGAAPYEADDASLPQRMLTGDAHAKREFDRPPR